MINLREAINRKLVDMMKSIGVVKYKEFKSSNEDLIGMLKECVKEGTPKPTQHKHQIEKLENLEKLSTFFKDALNNQIILRWSVYFNLETHFLSWGQKFYHQLKLNSFAFHIDENDQYAICNMQNLYDMIRVPIHAQ